jgi:hypothetical protein
MTLVAAVVAAGMPALAAGNTPGPWTIVPPFFMMENDSFFSGPDRHYTDGLYASGTSGERPDCGWCAALAGTLMLSPEGTSQYRYGLFAGQSMFTPEDLSAAVPDPKDRPYAGWLFVGMRLYRESGNVLDRLQVTAGLVGPGSAADAIQRWWHALHWFGGVPPLGWHAQLKDEPGLVLSEQRLWRVSIPNRLIEAELLPEANASIGNIFDYAGVGATVRVGRNLNADWGAPRVEPAMEGSDFVNFDPMGGIGWNIFAGVEGRAILRNIFLDGNSFQHSANVAKNPLVADFNVGGAIFFKRISLHASYTVRTHEFDGQDGNDKFFSFALSYSY